MTFSDDLNKFSKKVETNSNAIFVGVGEECLRSIVEGSEITGSPGQQVDTGNLKASWQRWFSSPTEQHIATNAVYAPQEEDGISYAHGGIPIVQHSTVGGPHSTKLTVAGFNAILRIVAARVTGNA